MGTGNTTFPSPNALPETTVSNVSQLVATINLQRAGLYVFNPSTTVTLWITPQNPFAPTTPAVANGAGCIAIQPLQGSHVWTAQHAGLVEWYECHCELGGEQYHRDTRIL